MLAWYQPLQQSIIECNAGRDKNITENSILHDDTLL